MSDRTFYASTYVVADGTTRTWPFSFAGVNTGQASGTTPYLYPEDVKVSELYTDADGNPQVTQRTGVLTAPNQITIDGPAVQAGREIRIYRETELRFPLVDYRDLQSVSEHDLDLANRQAVFVTQETRDVASSNLLVNAHGNYDAKRRRIINVASGIDPGDAVNMQQYRRTLRVPSTEDAIVPIPDAAGRANRILSFDAYGNPVALFPPAGTALELETTLRDAVNVANGAAFIARAAVALDGVKDLLRQPRRTDLIFILRGYFAGYSIGGGSFFWEAGRARSTHNGGTVLSPTVPWDGTAATLDDFIRGVGEAEPTGVGCWVRSQEQRRVSPEIFGARPGFSSIVTVPFQAAVNAAADGECFLSANYYRTGPIVIPSFVRIAGSGRGTTVVLTDFAETHLFTAKDPATTVNIELVNFRINGSRGSQLVPNDAVHLSSTAPTGVTLTRHQIRNLWITNVKGNGVYLDTACRESLITGVNTSDCDQYGFVCANSDSQVSDCIAGRSGMSGFYVRQGVTLVNCKSWYSGRIDGVGRGFECRDADNAKLIACWSQENKGHGYDVYGTVGTIKGVQFVACVSDSDNTSGTGKNGFNVVNATGSRFDVINRTFTGAAGRPQNGFVMGDACEDCEVTGTSVGHISRAIDIGKAVGINVDFNGRNSRIRNVGFQPTVAIDPWLQATARIYLTAGITMAAPQRSPHGMKLRIIFNQDPIGTHPVVFDPVFRVKWTPDMAANRTNIIDFICDGTQWIQVGTVTGL